MNSGVFMNSWKRQFYSIWIGQAFSQLSSSVLQFAIVWYLTEQTGSAMILSLAMLCGYLPQGLLGPFVGVYIDRLNRKKIMIGADLGIAAASLMLVFFSADGTVNTGLVLFVLVLRAVGTTFHDPTLEAITPQMVPREELTKCAGYTQSLESFSMIISPALAAILYSVWDLSWIVALDVVGAVVAAVIVTFVKIPTHKGMGNTQKVNLLKELKEGVSILLQNKGITGIVIISGIYTFAMMPISAFFPLICMRHFGGGTGQASFVEILFALGFLVGSLILGKWGGTKNKVKTILGSFLSMAFALLVSGFLPKEGYLIFTIMALIMGLSGPFYWGMYIPLLQQNFEPQYLGRIMTITSSIRLISGPSALVVSGVLSDKWGESLWFVVAGLMVTMCSVLLVSNKNIRNIDK